jgi:hypothetical protein
MFAVRYSNFQQLCVEHDLQNAASDLVAMLRDDIAPKSWWAVMLCDAVDLLQYRKSSHNSGHYFPNFYTQAHPCCFLRLGRPSCLVS